MRPVRLELQGFTSFRQSATIDFSGLDLFAITGPTGAGKTSIIDAVIYALFGRTPRIGDKDGAELISQGAERMTVLLEFKAGNKSYRLLRTLKRGSSQKLLLEMRQEGGDWEALSNKVFEVRAKVEEILGIDFDGFIKSIVLPQGEFDRFLRGDPSERRRILSDLLRLGIYEEMGKRARHIEQSSRMEQSVIEQHIASAYAGVSEERKGALEQALERFSTRQGNVSAELNVIHKAQPLVLKLSEQRGQQNEASKQVMANTESLKKSQASSELGRETAARHKRRLGSLDKLIEDCGYNSERHMDLKSLLPSAQEREQCLRAIANSETEHKTISTDMKRVLSEAERLKKNWEALAKDLKLKDLMQQEAKKHLDEKKQQHGSSDVILQVAEDLRAAEENMAEKTELEQSIAEIDQKIHDTHERLKQLKLENKEADTALEEARANLDKLLQQHAAIELRHGLKKGERCPVCDQTVSVVPSSGKHPGVQRAKGTLEQCEKAKEKSHALLLKQEHLSESLPIQLKTLKKNLRSVEASITKAAEKAERVLGSSPGKSGAKQLEKLAAEMSTLEAKYDTAAEGFQKAQEAEVQAKSAHLRDEHQIQLLSQQLKILEKTVSEKRKRLAELDGVLKGQHEPRALTEELKRLEKAKKELQGYEDEKKGEQSLYQSAETQYLTAEGVISEYQEQIAHLQSSITARATSIELMERSIRTELVVPEGIDPIKYVDQRRSSLEQESIRLAGDIAAAQKDLDFVTSGLKGLTEERLQLGVLKTKIDLYRELGIALKADQFISFVVEEALTNLSENGTEHFSRLSSGRYSFATQADDFLVVDHWNADETRSVNTLSGGESFLASLSLALALGDSLVELSTEAGRFSLDSLFLDEGFSTLDPETLDVVVQAIETLAGGERVIGIISHIPELAERFPAQIDVRKAVGGSTIQVRGETNLQKFATSP